MKNLLLIGAAAVCCGLVCASAKAETTYTWLASPASETWDTSSMNWNDGMTAGVPWVNDQANPNNATFGTSSKVKVSVSSAHYVNNLTIGGNNYTFNGSGPISVAGTITLNSQLTCNTPLVSGRADGSLHFSGTDWSIGFVKGQNTQTSTYLEGNVFFAPDNDSRFGVVPTSPATNIFVDGVVTLFTSAPVTVNGNRTMRIASGKALLTGSNHSITFKNQIVADNTEGYDHSRNTYLRLRDNWTGLITLDPGEGRTNSFGRLQNVKSQLKIASGVTKLTGSSGTDYNANMMIHGNGTSFSDTKGNLLIDGGELYNPQSQYYYVDVRQYGQVTVTNGGKVYMPDAEWLNGISGAGRLTVGKDGSFHVGYLRLSQSGTSVTSEIYLNEGGLIKTPCLYMDTDSKAVFAFNGGTFQSLATGDGRNLFVGNSSKWANVRFTIGEKGAVFDAVGQNIWWHYPLTSGVATGSDGGIRKTGNKLFLLTAKNTYTGPTVVEGTGNFCPRVDDALPPGTTIRISGGAGLDFNSYDTLSPSRDSTNWISRLEGYANINNCSGLHVTNAIAPSLAGNCTFGFAKVCDLRGDYEISADSSRCSCIYLGAAGQDISGLKPKLINEMAFDKKTKYMILNSPNGHVGAFDESGLPPGWALKDKGTVVTLVYVKGTTIVIR